MTSGLKGYGPMRILLTGCEVCFSMFLSHSSMFLNDCSLVMSYTRRMPMALR